MKKLIDGIKNFHEKVRPDVKDQFAQLALGQKPDALMIACSDSRVAPNLFASTDPGDLFVVRNVGNVIPDLNQYSSEKTAIYFALQELKVGHIIVCGHTECGACKARFFNEQKDHNIQYWLNFISLNPESKDHNELSCFNVLHQIEKLKKDPLIYNLLSEKKLKLHAWMFNLKEAEVLEFSENDKKFKVIE